MTRRHRLVILCLCVSAISSIALAIAQAESTPEWMTPPKPELPAELSAKAEKTLVLTTKISGIKVEFSCEGISSDKALLEAEGKGSGMALFSACITRLNGVVAKACEPNPGGVKPGTITSNALKSQLVLHEATTLTKVTAVTGETFATIEMSKECAIGSKVPVIGSFYAKDANGEFEVEKEAHVFEEGPLTELWVVTKTVEHKATIGGSVGLSLTGEHLGRDWSGLGSPPEWMTPPKPELPAELSAKAEKTLVLTTKISGIKVEFSCEGISSDKALLEAEGKGSGMALFSACITRLNGVVAKACEPNPGGVKPGTITSNALKSQLVLHEATTLTKVTAVTGETFATIEMSKECAIGSKVPVIGSFYAKDANGEFEVEKEAHVFEEGPLTELWVVTKTVEHKATIGGSVGLSLTGEHLGRDWSGLGSPPEWMTPPKPELPAELSAKAEKTLVLTTKISGIKVEFSCEGISSDKALLEAEGKGSGMALFSACITRLNGVVAKACEPNPGGVKPGTITSNALKSQLVLHEATTLTKVTAVTGETFATIEMSKECAIGSKVPVIGSFYAKDANGEFEVEKEAHVFEEGPLTELWVVTKTVEHKATIGGSVGLSLTGEHLGRDWSGLGS